ncbi:hypothetical protein KAU45_07640, partial [bacterium]|nr:hypothetical protein [bacterium]
FEYTGSEYWKLCADWGDVTRYLYQAETGKLIYTPYRYRPLGIWLAGGVSALTGMDVSYAFVLNNTLAVLAAAIGFLLYLKRFHGFNRYLALLGSILFVTSTAVVSSLPFPLIDSLTYPLIVGVFWFARSKKPLPFIGVSLVGVLTKEVMGIAGPLYLVANLRRGQGWKQNLSTTAVSLVPVLGYIAVRLVAGGGIDEVNYGYNLLAGEFPNYYARLLYWGGLWMISINTFTAFGFLWLGLFNLRRDRFLLKAFLIVAIPVFLATVLFSARISRPLGLLFPIVIPLFLLYFRRFGLEDRL